MFILPIAHLIACALPFVLTGEFWTLWWWGIVYVIDLPASLIVDGMHLGRFSLVCVGTIWWLFVNWVIVTTLRAAVTRIKTGLA